MVSISLRLVFTVTLVSFLQTSHVGPDAALHRCTCLTGLTRGNRHLATLLFCRFQCVGHVEDVFRGVSGCSCVHRSYYVSEVRRSANKGPATCFHCTSFQANKARCRGKLAHLYLMFPSRQHGSDGGTRPCSLITGLTNIMIAHKKFRYERTTAQLLVHGPRRRTGGS